MIVLRSTYERDLGQLGQVADYWFGRTQDEQVRGDKAETLLERARADAARLAGFLDHAEREHGRALAMVDDLALQLNVARAELARRWERPRGADGKFLRGGA